MRIPNVIAYQVAHGHACIWRGLAAFDRCLKDNPQVFRKPRGSPALRLELASRSLMRSPTYSGNTNRYETSFCISCGVNL